MMYLDLTEDGDPQSSFLRACAARRINLGESGDGAHPLQVIPSQWRSLSATLKTFVDELATVATAFEPDGDALIGAFRPLLHDATELFDSYALLIPARIGLQDKARNAAIAEFKKTARRLRDDCAGLCKRCENNGSRLMFLRTCSPSSGRTDSRILFTSYGDDNAPLQDNMVDEDQRTGISLVRWGHQLAHDLLRIDWVTGALIDRLAEDDSRPMPGVSPRLPVGDSMRKLAAIRATRNADEGILHDGIMFSASRVWHVRVVADHIGPSADLTASATTEAGVTRHAVARRQAS